jgi:hypothetical protein
MSPIEEWLLSAMVTPPPVRAWISSFIFRILETRCPLSPITYSTASLAQWLFPLLVTIGSWMKLAVSIDSPEQPLTWVSCPPHISLFLYLSIKRQIIYSPPPLFSILFYPHFYPFLPSLLSFSPPLCYPFLPLFSILFYPFFYPFLPSLPSSFFPPFFSTFHFLFFLLSISFPLYLSSFLPPFHPSSIPFSLPSFLLIFHPSLSYPLF